MRPSSTSSSFALPFHLRLLFFLWALMSFRGAAQGTKKGSTVAAPTHECPKGYEMIGKQCEKVEYAPAEVRCPSGYKPDSSNKRQCVKVISHPPDVDCPDGTEKFDGKCVTTKRADPQMRCPKGYEKKPGEMTCIRVMQLHPKEECDEGTYRNGVCVRKKYEDPTPSCPDGYDFQPHRHKKHTRQLQAKKEPPPKKSPPPKHHKKTAPAPEKHHKKEVTPPKTHHKKHVVAAPKHHKKGDHADGVCVKQVAGPAEGVCPDGYERRNGTCVALEQTDTEKECPEGYEYTANDECVQEDQLVATASCDDGELVDGVCKKEEILDEVIKCPAAYTYNNQTGNCEKSVCQIMTEPPETVCSDGSPPPCEKEEEVLPQFTCPPDYEVVNNTCVRMRTANVTQKCPEGYTLRNGVCERVREANEEPRCPKGTILSEDGTVCIKYVEARPDYDCPPEYDLEKDRCVQELQGQPKLLCPKSYEYKDNMCEKTQQVPPTRYCPPKYYLINGECVTDVYQGPARQCSDDTTYNRNTGMCEGKAYEAKETYCPKNYSPVEGDEKGARCQRVDTAKPKRSCPKHFVYDDKTGQCVQAKKTSRVRHLKGK
ncbi:unnamed protein product [Vitrella brassicaformis CCMP3155]|uniref:Oocyst wall protein n=1 Tax=Vitrella brassicaformis (strain CCMP3155) TaxID=1169540 RepID=A0A0G4EWJ3_VITBC|nr:unnamed protein product [Vitrella brassicaformis CCMP3155]|mmetsp:Transcript_48785/g.122168  ORF Transcript_48785/g.122168 Transcript_48785/m.122168 type:complete len:597 (-) Transcript_48785:68-1858(-)|eukprot:CEM03337.1 unnamed protein product [Vitrella brassicaformis CCMP3155]